MWGIIRMRSVLAAGAFFVIVLLIGLMGPISEYFSKFAE